MRSTYRSDPSAINLFDQMISDRFSQSYGVSNAGAYFQYVHKRSTIHLTADLTQRRKRTTGGQHEGTIYTLEGSRVLAHVPMNDIRKAEVVYATLWATTLLNLIECGADTSWFLAYKGPSHPAPQVRTKVPFRGLGGPTNATIARLIVGARKGQQASMIDRNPLNLRTENIRLIGDLRALEGRKGRAKADSRAVIRNAVDARNDTSKRKRDQQ